MFSLMYGFWKILFRKTEFHILIVGLDHAGKTVRAAEKPCRGHVSHPRHPRWQSLLERLKAIFTGLEPLPPGKIPPTVGLNIGRMQVNRQRLIFWDLGGAKSLRSLWEQCDSARHSTLGKDACVARRERVHLRQTAHGRCAGTGTIRTRTRSCTWWTRPTMAGWTSRARCCVGC
jgi:hypothetical protein